MADATENTDEFQDPLNNYEPPNYDDPLEQALATQTAADLQSTPFHTVAPDTTIAAAHEQLVGSEIACILVADENGKLVGVFSDRDLLKKVALEWESIKDHPLSEVMTADPVFVYETDPASAVLTVMAVSGYRHVPIVDLDRKVIGIVSPQRVIRFLQEETPAD